MWVTPGAPTASTCSSFGAASPRLSKSRAPPPRRIGTTEITSSSSRPAARYCCATDAPPPRETPLSPAAARACSSADSIPSVTKWKVVPLSISRGSRGWCVRTKTGWWNGGSSPHQPFHESSSHGPGPPPNMFRPMIVAPAPARMSSAKGVFALTSPPSAPWLSRNALSGTSHAWSCSPPIPGGFERGGWAMGVFDNETMTFINQTYQRADAFLFGRRTYELFAGYWGVRKDLEDPIVGALNRRPKYVASNTLTDPQWADTTVLSRDLAAAIGELKAKPGGELQVHGSGALTRWLLDNDLVDEINLLTCPVVVGQGTRLFPDAGPDIALELIGSRAFPKGITLQVYRPTGRPRYAT